ncbi:MAG: B12-binding domain-containing radical SAM protein, partial [Desulfobaccales bacterium]
MKVLLLNPEMPGAFWSFQETCKISGTKALLPPLGLLTVAALFPQEWEYRLADLNTGKKLTTADWQWADLVMISGMIIQKLGVLALIREAKARDKTVLVGGPYATSLPEEVLAAGADFLVRGEGENTIPLLLTAMLAGEQAGVFQAADKPDMALSPVPRFDLLNLEDYNILGIQTSRGCPFDCEFCDVVNLFGRLPRYKSPQQVIAELETLYRLGWRGGVFICDDNFIGNKDRARAILGQLTPWMKEHHDPFGFWTQASVNLGQNTEMIDLLTAANFGTIFLGVETPDEELLKLNRKYQNLSSPAAKSLTTITANGLTPMASFVIGFDHEKPGAGERICQFVEENHLPLVMLNTLFILPNTSLW